MQQQDVARVFNDPLAQQLLHSPIPARLAYTETDGTPHVVPVGYKQMARITNLVALGEVAGLRRADSRFHAPPYRRGRLTDR